MKNYIAKQSVDRIELLALSVRPNRSTKKIVTKMLDGSSSVQQIGNESKSTDITICVTDKQELDAICASCEQVTVYHYGEYYTGVISSEAIQWAPLLPGDRVYKGSFSLVVTS